MRVAAALATLFAAVALVACGSSGDDGGTATTDVPVPAASEFPKGGGQSLAELVGRLPEGPVMAQTVSVMRKGQNRVAFALFDIERHQVKGAQVAIYVLDKKLKNAK